MRWIFLGLALCASVSAYAARTHVVRAGETLSSIAGRYEVSVRELSRANRLRDADLVKRGQKLLVPDLAAEFATHKVARGESLEKIAARYRTTVADIRAYNELANPNQIVAGQTLRIPMKTAPIPARIAPPAPAAKVSAPRPPAAVPAPSTVVTLPAAIATAISGQAITAGRWKNIVVHHSATREGSAKGMDRYHREERNMENGLAYHFVIGNGNGMDDGELFVGNRWKKQLDGGHLAIPALNANSLGICLVGDFQRQRPTRAQLDALAALVRAVMAKTGVTLENVTSHSIIHPSHTKCPGKHFSLDALKRKLR